MHEVRDAMKLLGLALIVVIVGIVWMLIPKGDA